jgi:hypothetical protein
MRSGNSAKKLLLFSLLIVLFITYGCDEFGPLEGIFPDSALRLVQDDTLVKSGTSMDIEMDFSESPPDRVTGRLTGPGGFDQSLNVKAPPDGWNGVSGQPGSIAIPAGLAEGYYQLSLVAWREDKLLTEIDRRLFITGEEWTIRGLEIYPPRVVSGGVFVAKAVLALPDGSDPWLRWRQDGRLVAEGLRSEGLGRVILQAGSDSNTEAISLELLSGVPDGEKQVLRTFNTGIYKADQPEASPDDLGPPDSYSLLMHFNGILRDDSAAKAHTGIQVLGSPWPVQTPGGMGFRFGPGSGLIVEDLSSDFGSSNRWQPFSITLKILPLTTERGQIVALEGTDGFALELEFTGFDGLKVSLSNGEMETVSVLPLESAGNRPQAITLSLLPGEDSLDLVWQVNGDTRAAVSVKSQVRPPDGKVRFTLGGENGFDGVVTELGIHSMNGAGQASAEGDRFEFFSRLNQDVILAEGFEDGLVSVGIIPGSGTVINGGSLLLFPSSSVRFPAGGNLSFRIGSATAGNDWTLALYRRGEETRQWTVSDTEAAEGSEGYTVRVDKSDWISDNDADAYFELKASSQNGSNLRLEHILVTRD